MAGDSPSKSDSRTKWPALVPLGHHTGKPPIPLHRPVTLIGSRSNARIHLTSSSVSKAHALVVKDGPVTYIRDLASRTHLFINGEQVKEHDLEDGDLLKIGTFTLKFARGHEEESREAPGRAPEARLDVSGADYPVPLDERVVLIGRRSSCDIHLLEASVSVAHAVLFQMNGAWHVRDLGSRTHTWVNGVAVHQHQLNPGDRIRIGETTLTYVPVTQADAAAEGTGIEMPMDLSASRPADSGVLPLVEADALDISASATPDEAAVLAPAGDAAISTENAAEPAGLSVRPENLSTSVASSESVAGRGDHATDEVAEPDSPPADEDEDALLPRRGWRPAPTVADDAGSSTESPERAEVPSGQPESRDEPLPLESDEEAIPLAPVEADQSKGATYSASDAATSADADIAILPEATDEVLQFDQDNLPGRSSDEPHGATATIDLAGAADDASTAVLDRDDESVTAGSFVRAPSTGEDSLDIAPPPVDEPRAVELEAPDFSPQPDDRRDTTDTESSTESTIEPPAERPLLDLGRGGKRPRANKSRGRADRPMFQGEPAFDLSPATPPTPPAAPERVAASRTRRKPAMPIAEQRPVQPPRDEEPPAVALPEPQPSEPLVGQQPEDAGAETIDRTEPTPHSALDLLPATEEVKLDERAATTPSLSDTALDRAVQELSADSGEIVEAPAAEAEPVRPEPDARADLRVEAPKGRGAPRGPRVWGANQDNYLGGVPVSLPPLAPPPFGQSPITPTVRPAEPIPPAVAAAVETPADDLAAAVAAVTDDTPRVEGDTVETIDANDLLAGSASDAAVSQVPLVEPEADQTASAEQLDAVNALIDEILAPGGDGNGGATELNEPPPAIEPIELEAVDEAIAAEEPVGPVARVPIERAMPSEPPLTSPPQPAQSRPVIPLPPPPARGQRLLRRRRGEMSGGDYPGRATRPVRQDERIPPYAGPAGAATVGQITSGFDGLAMPPVREADVFSQMSPPAIDPMTGLEADPFASPASPSPSALTPMDMVRAEETASPRARRMSAGLSARAPDRAPRATPVIEARRERPPAQPTAAQASEVAEPLELVDPVAEPDAGAASRPQRPARPHDAPHPMAHAFAQTVHAAPVYAEGRDTPEDTAAEARRRKLRRVPILVALMFVLAGAAGAAVWFLVPVRSRTEVQVTFANYTKLQELERRTLQKKQRDLLTAEPTRQLARRKLGEIDPEISPGFLENTQKYLATATLVTWPESRKGVMLLRHEGAGEPEADKARLRALGMAVVAANADTLVREARGAKNRYEQLLRDIAENEQEQQSLTKQIESLRTQSDAAPTGAQLGQIRAESEQLNKAWNDAVAARVACEAELKRLKQTPSAGAAPTAAADPAAADAQIGEWQAQLKELTTKLADAQTARSDQAARARAALDASLQEFGKQIAAAQGAMNGSPELANYVSAAQRLQETTRTLINELIDRQEKQYSRLNDLKTTLTEKVEERRTQQIQGDPEMKEWTQRLEVARRQFNAARGAGLRKESEDKKAEIDLLENMIQARQEAMPKDPLVDAIAQLQQIIDATQQNLEADRKRTEVTLEQIQQGFVNSQDVEKMPAAQKAIAGDLEKRLADINAARQQYTVALNAATSDDDETVKQLRTAVASMTANIEARKKQLADEASKRDDAASQQDREAQIASKEQELAELLKTEATARAAYEGREKDLRDAENALALARAGRDQLEEMINRKNVVDRQLTESRRNVEMAKSAAESAVEPLPVTENDVRGVTDPDKRPVYAVAAVSPILLVFLSWILLTLHGAAKGFADAPRGVAPAAPDDESEMRDSESNNGITAPTAMNGNGRHNAGDEDHEPAVV
jgi:pSer/pThr/pTyr-binding forkhead associated (FHA) protein